MSTQIVWPLVFTVAGALTYSLSPSPKLAEVGKLALFAGFLWLVYGMAHGALRF